MSDLVMIYQTIYVYINYIAVKTDDLIYRTPLFQFHYLLNITYQLLTGNQYFYVTYRYAAEALSIIYLYFISEVTGIFTVTG